MHTSLRQIGFSLVEVMVSLVVVSVGMIGIAALYGQGLNAGRTALSRTQAVNLAADMADRIRVNRLGGAAYANAPADRNCDAGDNNDCSPVEMAEHDLWQWTNQVAQNLPNGVGQVVVAGGVAPTFTISVVWEETGTGPVTHQIAVQIPPM